MSGIVCFTVGEIYSKIVKAPVSAWPVIHSVCRARPEGYRFMPKYKSGQWDGYIRLIKGQDTIPTGLLRLVRDTLADQDIGCSYKYEGVREIKYAIPYSSLQSCLDGVELRDYQADAVTALLSAERGIAKMATNAGKTVVFAALIKILGNRNALIIVQSKELLYQTSGRLAEYLGRPVGVIGDSHRDRTDICVATIQTLNSMRGKLGRLTFHNIFSRNRVLVVDECHHVANNKTFDILMDIPGWYRYGSSGTPLDRGALNDLKLIACTGPVQVDVTNAQLIEAKWSAKPIIYVHNVPYSTDTWDADYQTAYSLCIVDNEARNLLVRTLALQEVGSGTVLIIVNRIRHGADIADMLGTVATFVNGNSPIEERMDVLRRMADGERFVVVATPIFDEGVDVPALDTIILACGGKSHIKLLQRIGRGLRKKSGDNILRVHDFLDGGNEYLLEHSEERVRVYKAEGFQVEYATKKGGPGATTSIGLSSRGGVRVPRVYRGSRIPVS